MRFRSEFIPLPLKELRRQASIMKADGWRFIQTHAVKTDEGVDLYYSFMKNGKAQNYRVEGITPDRPVPSISDMFLAAFVFENEARELFGVDMRDIAIDFQGAMYAPAEQTPMTFISPEQKAAKERARKIAASKKAKEASGDAFELVSRRAFVLTPELQARLDAKMPTLSDEKRAKVKAALKARAEEAAAAGTASKSESAPKQAPSSEPATSQAEAPADAVLLEKIAGMDEAKAAKVRAALGIEGAPGASTEAEVESAPAIMLEDEELAKALSLMDKEKAGKVMSVLNSMGGE